MRDWWSTQGYVGVLRCRWLLSREYFNRGRVHAKVPSHAHCDGYSFGSGELSNALVTATSAAMEDNNGEAAEDYDKANE